MPYSSDVEELDSEEDSELEMVLKLSRVDYNASQASRNAIAGPSTTNAANQPSYLRKHTLNGRISNLDKEIEDLDRDIKQKISLRASLNAERHRVREELGLLENDSHILNSSTNLQKGKSVQQSNARVVDYRDSFDWTPSLKERMRQVFQIAKFRLCQEAVCNASLDGRDIICVMPTGGGKSLTYQLPALLVPGCTLVISPLIALIADQILHLQEAGVAAVRLTGAATREEARLIQNRLLAMASDRHDTGSEIKLCYVTPEKISKSTAFKGILQKLANVNKLARIVVDEAHCVSQLGHDFRPDYKKIKILRELFPQVPITALSATCPETVCNDLLATLKMHRPLVDGTAASPKGTVFFSAPLYRKNLHYVVLPKPSAAKDAIKVMREYILQNHKDHTGIIYCLSQKDAEDVADALYKTSEGVIKTGVYHAKVQDSEKEKLHIRWRQGDVKVVCATIAFGLGIDKGDVRFVLHHSISKSLDGYYQESGRAGRDGKDSDCVLYYRPQDATRLGSLVAGELESAQEKLYDMLRFAQDAEQCRKIQFAQYFSTSSHLSLSSWTTEETDALERCGHCDNCTRPPDSIDRRNVTMAAWQILRVAEAIQRDGGRATTSKLAELARGVGGGSFTARGGRKKKKGRADDAQEIDLDVEQIAGGKVDLSKDDTEALCVHLLTEKYLKASVTFTAYSTNLYVIPGLQAVRLTRLSQESIARGNGPQIEYCFVKKTKRKAAPRKAAPRKRAAADTSPGGPVSPKVKRSPHTGSNRKRKRPATPDDVESLDSDHAPPSEDSHDESAADELQDFLADEDSEIETSQKGVWNYSYRPQASQTRPRQSTSRRRGKAVARALDPDDEIICLSSD